MKINGINTINFNHNLKALRAGNISRTYQNSVSKPEDYMSIFIPNPLNYTITDALSGQGTFSLEIDKETIQECLMDDRGNVDLGLREKFGEIHKFCAQKMYKDCQTNLKYYRQRTKIYGDDINYTSAMKRAINRSYRDFEKIPLKAADYTRRIFQLSKTPMGYDFEDLDIKYELVKSFFQQADIYDRDNLDEDFEVIAETSKDDSGKFESQFVLDVLDLEREGNYCDNLYDIMTYILKYTSYDKDSTKEIIDTMCELAKESEFALGSDYFEYLMELCFDKNKKYSQRNSDTMLNGTYAVKDYAQERPSEQLGDVMTQGKISELEEKIIEKGCQLIGEYFEEFSDEYGEILPEPEEDIKNYIDDNIEDLVSE